MSDVSKLKGSLEKSKAGGFGDFDAIVHAVVQMGKLAFTDL